MWSQDIQLHVRRIRGTSSTPDERTAEGNDGRHDEHQGERILVSYLRLQRRHSHRSDVSYHRILRLAEDVIDDVVEVIVVCSFYDATSVGYPAECMIAKLL